MTEGSQKRTGLSCSTYMFEIKEYDASKATALSITDGELAFFASGCVITIMKTLFPYWQSAGLTKIKKTRYLLKSEVEKISCATSVARPDSIPIILLQALSVIISMTSSVTPVEALQPNEGLRLCSALQTEANEEYT